MRRALGALRLAVSTLTIVPIPSRGIASPAELADSRLAFPAVGVLIGLVLAGLSELCARLGVAQGPAAFLLVISGVAVTGGLHLDGLADTGDGLFLGGGPERRLAVMRDPHVGTFGLLALVLTLLGKFAALEALADRGRGLALIEAAVVGRLAILVAAGAGDYARPEGTGRLIIEATSQRESWIAGVIAILTGLGLFGPLGLIAAFLAMGLVWGLSRLAKGRLGGVTGDILGAAVELGELVFLVVLGARGRSG
jgi:adenosylcobinamide-GDP ribazoletransferase